MQVPVAQWNQAGGNPAGSGFRAVNTIVPAHPASRYIHLPSDAVASSPVIGPNGEIVVGTQSGTIYVCRIDSDLPRRAPFERETRVADLDFAAFTPAVAADGTVYCLFAARHPPAADGPPASGNVLVVLSNTGNLRWSFPVPPHQGEFNWSAGTIRGAPRLISGGGAARILFVVEYEVTVRYPEILSTGPGYLRRLYIIDENGGVRLEHTYENERDFVEAHGGGGFGSTVTLDDLPELPPGPKLPDGIHPYRNTPVVSGSMPSNEPWTIMVNGRSGLYAFRWSYLDDSLVDEPGRFSTGSASTSPTAFANGLLAAAGSNAMVLYETDQFSVYGRTFILGRETMAAGGLRQVYCLSRGGVLNLVDSNGEVRKRRQLGADTVAFPVLSANHVHVVTMTELRTLTLDLEDVASVDLQGQSSFPGRSSPAIGPDGSVYLAIGSYLHCYLAPGTALDPHDLVVR